jgi:hypothetical protein
VIFAYCIGKDGFTATAICRNGDERMIFNAKYNRLGTIYWRAL